MALGEVGLEFSYFYSLTPRVFYNIMQGYRVKEDRLYKDSWERVRVVYYAALAPHTKGNKTMQGLLPFPWDVLSEDVDKVELTDQMVKDVLKEGTDYWQRIDELRIKNKTENGKFIPD